MSSHVQSPRGSIRLPYGASERMIDLLVWLLACMDPLMLLYVAQLGEFAVAITTDVGLDATVNATVLG